MTRKKDSENKRMRQLKFSAEKSEQIKTIVQSLKDSGAPPNLLSAAWDEAARSALQIKPMKELLFFDQKQGKMLTKDAERLGRSGSRFYATHIRNV
jgi:hypothetical protein